MIKNPPASSQEIPETWVQSWVGKTPWSKKWQWAIVFLSGNFHGERSRESYSPWSCKESDTTEPTQVATSRLKYDHPPTWFSQNLFGHFFSHMPVQKSLPMRILTNGGALEESTKFTKIK